MSNVRLRRWGALMVLVGVSTSLASACVDDSGAPAGPGAVDAGFDVAASDGSTSADGAATVDATSTDAAPGDGAVLPDGSADAPSDAPTDAALDAGVPATGYRLANMTGSALDFCIWGQGDVEPTLPAFAGSGGVPAGAVSAYFPFAKMAANFSVKYTPAGSTCAAAADAGFNEFTETGNGAPHRTRWTTSQGSLLGGGFLDTTTATAGKETVLFTRMQSGSSTLTFVPDNDAGPSVTIQNNVPTLLDPNVTGSLVGAVPTIGTPSPRPFKTTSGGIVRVFLTGSQILVCDELAPPNGALSDCRPTVRAP